VCSGSFEYNGFGVDEKMKMGKRGGKNGSRGTTKKSRKREQENIIMTV